jgi:hypothetical protein
MPILNHFIKLYIFFKTQLQRLLTLRKRLLPPNVVFRVLFQYTMDKA